MKQSDESGTLSFAQWRWTMARKYFSPETEHIDELARRIAELEEVVHGSISCADTAWRP
jgi:hypothetical protein